MRYAGQVIWFNRAKGYGILACERESDVFFDVGPAKSKRKTISAGDPAWFEIVDGETGPEATGLSWHPHTPEVSGNC